tara:strand:+ start:2432 stop:2626 length:195 start_codon:yes stop_codon:yes gene_type:complete
MKFITQQRTPVQNTTKIFQGVKSLLEAVEYANENRSYYFVVYKTERNPKTKKTETEFYGYGVPK